MAKEQRDVIVVSRIIEGVSSKGSKYFGMIDEGKGLFSIWDTKMIEEAKKQIKEGSRVLVTFTRKGNRPARVSEFQVLGVERVEIGREEASNRRTALMQAVKVALSLNVNDELRLRYIGILTDTFLQFLSTGSCEGLKKILELLKEEEVKVKSGEQSE